MYINSCSFGIMVINDKSYNSDLIIFPDKIINNWRRKKGHSLFVEDLAEVIQYKPEILIIGCGMSGIMVVPFITRDFLSNKGIHIIDANTDKACEIFNKQTKLNKKIVGAFHLTC